MKTCMQRSHDKMRDLIVRVFFITCVVHTILPNFLKRMVVRTPQFGLYKLVKFSS